MYKFQTHCRQIFADWSTPPPPELIGCILSDDNKLHFHEYMKMNRANFDVARKAFNATPRPTQHNNSWYVRMRVSDESIAIMELFQAPVRGRYAFQFHLLLTAANRLL